MARGAMVDDVPFHVGLTPERIVEEAVVLTRETHLLGWSVRDLARRLDVAASVLYHHVGGKDVIVRRVVEHVVRGVALPDRDLPWQDWFRELVLPARSVVGAHPGVARWLLTHGPTLPPLQPAIAQGIEALRRDGLGEHAAMACAALVNAALSAVAMGDDRRLAAGDGAVDLAAMRAALVGSDADPATVEHIVATTLDPFLGGADAVDAGEAHYLAFVLETTIAGLEALQARGWPGL